MRYSRFRSSDLSVVCLAVTLVISVDVFANTSSVSYHRVGAVLHPPCSRGCPQLLLVVKLYVEIYLVGLTFIPVFFAVEESSQRSGTVRRDDPDAPD